MLGVIVPETQESQSMGGTQRGWTGKFRKTPGVVLDLTEHS
jgi:hypothetical protein